MYGGLSEQYYLKQVDENVLHIIKYSSKTIELRREKIPDKNRRRVNTVGILTVLPLHTILGPEIPELGQTALLYYSVLILTFTYNKTRFGGTPTRLL